MRHESYDRGRVHAISLDTGQVEWWWLWSKYEIVVEVDVAKAMQSGVQFFRSDNGYILTRGRDGILAPEFVTVHSRADKRPLPARSAPSSWRLHRLSVFMFSSLAEATYRAARPPPEASSPLPPPLPEVERVHNRKRQSEDEAAWKLAKAWEHREFTDAEIVCGARRARRSRPVRAQRPHLGRLRTDGAQCTPHLVLGRL